MLPEVSTEFVVSSEKHRFEGMVHQDGQLDEGLLLDRL